VAQPAHAAAGEPTSAASQSRLAWRAWSPWVLIVLAALIALVSALNVWVKRQALSTDHWTNASSQLLENEKIRGAISVYLVNQVYQNIDVPTALEQRLPPRFKGLAPVLAANLQNAAINVANRLLARPKIQQLWREANRRAHELFIAVLNGKHGILQSTNGNVVLNLQPLLKQLAQQTGLGGRLAERLPPDAGKITIMKGNQLESARRAVKVVRVLSYFLFFLVLGLVAAAVYIARQGRRRAVILGAGISILVVGLLVLVVRRYAGNYLVDALTGNPDAKGAVSAAWAIGTELLRTTGINAVIYGIAIIFAAWLAGPSRAATWVRRMLAPTMRDRPWIIYSAVAAALCLILLAGPTDSDRIFPLLILFGFAFVGTEVWRRQAMREFPATAERQLPAG
jgi:hypothetical protein